MSSGKQSASNKTSSLSTHAEQARKSCSTAEDTSEQLPVVTPGPETQPGATFLTKPNPKELDPLGPQAADFAATSSTEQAETDCIVKQGASEEATDISGISQEDSDDDFNIVQPTLIKQLKKILDQYPDDGQILKELIQNAEDAGASNVKFLCDYHRYGTERLHHPELGKFQGPALYAYNNETFTAKDWKGIKMLSDSIKDKDPMKVGRFGLGFKSVYHITDLPSIVSGTQVGVFDPHKQYFSDNNGERGTGHRWRFEQDRKKMNQIPDQFAPYKGIFGCGKESFSSRYSGTLFRFPLREKPSRLSDNLYSPEKVQKEHFESFQADANMVLLFLKNLESIELYIRGDEESSPRKTFEVKIADESLENVRAKRKELIDKVKDLKYGEVPSSPVSVTYPLTIECTSYEGHAKRHTYILTNYVSGGEIGSCVKQLMEAEDLSYLPWVGVAMAVEQVKTAEDPKGHLFCFLPLPVQKKSLTGLPLHVNGFFALSQNRRHLKWPTANQEEEGKELTDKALQWNKFLVKEVVPCAYADLLLHLIKMPREEVPVELFYKAWPDPVKTDPKWLEVLHPLFKQLLKCATFHTPADGGTWLKIKEAIFDTMNEDKETTEVLLNTLRLANENIVSAPQHVRYVIAEHHGDFVHITPKLVQVALRQCPSCYVNCTRSDKLLLLKYVLKDSRFEDLYDLELLPLSNGTFTKFLQKDHPSCMPIYIPSQEHAQSLLPGLDHLFLDSDIEKEMFLQLQKACIPGNPQLQHLDENAVITLLPKSFPCDWSSGEQVTWYPGNTNQGHPSKEWLKSLWRYMSLHFPNDLSKLENQPLIPVNWSGDKVTLARLCSPSGLVLQSTPHGRLDVTVSKVLTNVGITVISELPEFVMSHPAVLGKYIHRPLVSSVLQAMMTLTSACGYGAIVRQLEQQSPSDKRALRVFIAKASTFSDRERDLVRQLPLLETLENSGSRSSRFVTAEEIPKAAPREVLPIDVIQEVIDIRHEGSESLARLSRVTMLSTTELLRQIVFQDVRELKYTGSDVDKLMKHVFDHFHEYKKEMPEFQLIVKTLPFVTKRNGEREKPSDLFDPTVACVQNILADEDVFPHGPVYNERGALVILSDLGLKEEKDLTACDVLKSVRHIENMLPPENAQRKALALLEHLNSDIRKMLDTVDGQTLGTWLSELRWVSPMTAGRPPSYPESLPFCGLDSAHLLKPTQMKSSKFVYVVGSAKPVVAIKNNCFLKIADVFGWEKVPDTKDVISHLKKVIECYIQTEKPTYMIIVKEIYQHLVNLDSRERTEALSELDGQKWIWNGAGFSSPINMVCEKPFTDLSPYICPLPTEVTGFNDVFSAGGMRDESETLLLLRVLELIKEKYVKGQNHTRTDVKRDLQLSIDILNELKPCLEECLEEDVKERLLIPTHVTDDSTLHLAPIHECTYCDAEWLKQGHDAGDVDEDGDVRIMYVHRNIPNDTAEILGVPSLMNRMLDADEFDVGEEFGQEEPLTRSIHRLLEGYTDGFAVPKELIQNADDAGATEVKFLYDERTNEDCMTCLFDEGMKACQGPALWAYNNAVFTDEDFTNITKLNGATKERDTQTIGRFGSGFNAVYNLTDVPSFVSRNSFVIFDPHKTHLGNAIGKGKPGIRIDLKKNKQKLRKLGNQFKPFNDIFGCDLRPEAGQDSYDGTLFRFPLRTKEQALKSELKDLHYVDREMRELLNKLVKGAESLLLFTQTVCWVSVYHLPGGSSGKPQPLKLFEVKKSPVQMIRDVSLPFVFSPTVRGLSEKERDFAKQSSFLRASSYALKSLGSSENFPRSSLVIEVEMKHTEDGANFFGFDEAKSSSSPWLVSSAMGTASALQFAKKDKTLLPTAGVAVRLLGEVPGPFFPEPIMDPNNNNNTKHSGKLFCYLPLPCDSGLPLHVNGFFAVASNRRCLKEKTEDDKYYHEDDWNKVLMEDAVSEAYISALEDLKVLLIRHRESCCIYDLWPRTDLVSFTCQPIVTSFYSRLAAVGPNTSRLFSDGDNWVSIDEVLFLDPVLRSHNVVGNIAFQMLRAYTPHSKMVVDLPLDIMKSFIACGYEDAIKKRSLSSEDFYHDIFLPNITETPVGQRDPLMLYALDEENLRALLMDVPCIPVSPTGEKLKRPRDLVHPRGAASFLYSPEDGWFPYGTKDTYVSPARLEKLVDELGMWNDNLGWEEVIERAQSAQKLNRADHEGALKRSKALIQFLDKKLTAEEEKPPGPNVQESLINAKFLPVLSKPEKFPFRWAGEEFVRCVLSPKDIFQKKEKNLVSCTWPILNDSSDGCGSVPDKVKDLLGFKEKTVCLDDVKAQLEIAIASERATQTIDSYKEMGKILHSIYGYLQEHLDRNGEEIMHFLADKKFILGETRLLCAKQVAFNFQVDCPPHLYKLPRDLTSKFCRLMGDAGVRKDFDVEDYVRTLQLLKKRFGDDILDDDDVQLTANLARLIDSWGQETTFPIQSDIYLPDIQKRLHLASELCIKECNINWILDEEEVKYVHPMIPQETCINLGVNTRQEEILRNRSVGVPFGQREELTTRLKHILMAYPSEKEILKELLQNADDSQATEMYLIKDPRQHGEEHVFANKWKPLQGPALCVFNNKPFTEADLAGIQNLGEGSRGDDPNKTGQYGVGFNAVYHLTDAPSFLTRGSEIGDVLCVLDPHCKFVPGATPLEPGRMFRDIDKLRVNLTDVFPCYLEEHFPVDSATMFRFPLRTAKMAEESKVCETPTTTEDLGNMMDKFKSEMFEVLLFVNCVNKISLCEVAEDGKLTVLYEVSARLSEEDAKKRTEFSNYVGYVGTQLRKKEMSLPEMRVKEVSYVVDLKDNEDCHEKWLVVQRIGFEPGLAVPESLLKAFGAGNLTLLPRGGVASLLERAPYTFKPKKAFCFLPLPVETGLPVHVNGHFALDHESRRTLWRDEHTGYRTDWNNTLLGRVIAPCYVTLLSTVRKFLELPLGSDGITQLSCKTSDAVNRISEFMDLFPSPCLQDPYWVTMSEEVYRYVAKQGVRLLPVLRDCTLSGNGDKEPTGKGHNREFVEVTWLRPSEEEENGAFFNNLQTIYPPKRRRQHPVNVPKSEQHPVNVPKSERLKAILLNVGFTLIEAPLYVYENFRSSGVRVNCVSPHAVLAFFRSFMSRQSRCRLQDLPRAVKDTSLKDVESVKLLLKYCCKEEGFMESLQGLPLLVTQDEILRVFDWSSPSFLSKHVDILPQCGSEFVHCTLYKVFHGEDTSTQRLFKVFDVTSMASRLHLALSVSVFNGVNCCVEWKPLDDDKKPFRFWVTQVWKFLYDETEDIRGDCNLDDSGKTRAVLEKLKPLNDWCLLPARETVQGHTSLWALLEASTPKCYLVPICKANTVIHFQAGCMIADAQKEALRKMGLLEPDFQVMYMPSPARVLVANLNKPSQVLHSLRWKHERSPFDSAVTGYDKVLQYFSKHADHLKPEDAIMLRELPFYLTVSGNLAHLAGETACVLPESDTFLKAGMDVWHRRTRTVFLEGNPELSDLFDYLNCKSLSDVDLYCQFILPQAAHMSPEDRIAHLEHLRIARLPKLGDTDKESLFSSLRDLRFLPAEDGSLQKASFFYSPEEPVFKEMLSASMFPPEPFSCHDQWFTFLCKSGLVCEVTEEHFVNFAQQVAEEALSNASDDTQAKSRVLLSHLFKRPNLAAEDLLQHIRRISFISPSIVDESFCHIHRPYGVRENDTLPYICFEGSVREVHKHIVWTSANLLPRMADPHEYVNCEAVIPALKILDDPTMEQVISHCEIMCQKWTQEDDNCRCLKIEIMRDIYGFLQNHLDRVEIELKSALQHLPCVLVEGSRRLVFPRQIVVELMGHQEIKPHLYKVPLEFGSFWNLFMFLGSTRTATVEQYAMVLMEIYSESGSRTLERDEKFKCFKAVRGLFETLQEAHVKTIETGALLLPGTKKDEQDQVSLRESTKLVFDDAPHFRERVFGFEQMLFVDLKLCGLKASNFEVFVKMLPEEFRPRMLSSLIQERLSEPLSESLLQGKVEDLNQLFRSQEFAHATVRLIRHGDHIEGRITQDSILTAVHKCLSCIQVHGMDVLKTQLFYQGMAIPESTREITCFADKVVDGEAEVWNIYLQTCGGHEKTWSVKVAEIVNRITGGLLKDTLLYFQLLLTCTPREIRPLLDSFGIREDSSHDVHLPGMCILIEDHYLLEYAFKDFEAGECVGYERDDRCTDCEDDVPTYIYTIVIEEIKLEGAQSVSYLKKRYRIDIGDGKEHEISAIYLYKLRDESRSGQLRNLEEATDEITQLLEEAWELPKERRDVIIKRLYLTWHPDKNPGNEEFSAKVFQYLQSKIAQLGYSSSFSNWDRHAERQHDYIQSACPRPEEAKRWFRQAEADLKAAANDLSEEQPSYEWACFKCHQAAEKALKAAQYFQCGYKTNEHNLSYNASSLVDVELTNLARELDVLLGGATRMRYPDMTRPYIPNDVYDGKMALKAQKEAQSILDRVKSFID